jgi:hypothetical protein
MGEKGKWGNRRLSRLIFGEITLDGSKEKERK